MLPDAGSAVTPTGTVSARPAALQAVRSSGRAADAELRAAGARLRATLSSVGSGRRTGVPAWSESLGHDVLGLASSWSSLEGWVGRVGDALEAADDRFEALAGPLIGPPAPGGVGSKVVQAPEAAVTAAVGERPTWVDGLSDDEALSVALLLAERYRPVADRIRGAERDRLRAQMWPLVARLRQRWPAAVLSAPTSPSVACATPPPRRPDGLEDAIGLLLFAGPGRVPHTAGVVEAFGDGFLGGELSSPYDNLGGEVARSAGHVASGVLVFGDVRDALVEGSRDNWPGVALAVGGLVPGLGDAAKGAKAMDGLASVQRAGIPGGLAAHDALPKSHLSKFHIAKSDEFLRERLSRSEKPVVSTFVDAAEAEAAIGSVLELERSRVLAWLGSNQAKLVLERPDVSVGRVMVRGEPSSVEGRAVRVVLLRHEWEHQFRVLTAFPLP